MLVRKIQLANYRALSTWEQEFDTQFNVIIGVNGIGKTSILEALAILLSRVLPRVTPAKGGYRRFAPDDLRADTESITARVWLQFNDHHVEQSISQTFGERSKTTEPVPWKQLDTIASMYESRDSDSKRGVPIALFYTTDRAGFRLSKKTLDVRPRARAAAYHGALREKMVNYRSFVQWFRKVRVLANESEENARLLRGVEYAVKQFLPTFGELEPQENPPRLFLRKNGTRLGLRQLSDGERSFLSMVVDIARHLVLANPGTSSPLKTGKGVILIDELELHLHPMWQRIVVEKLQNVFPRLQYITTTHSPFVIQALKPQQLINLDPKSAANEFADKSIEDITEFVMGVRMPQKSERYERMMKTAEEYFRLLRAANPDTEEELAKLKQALDELAEPFSDDPAYMALLRLERETALGGETNAASE